MKKKTKISPDIHQIYGIYDFQEKKLIYVDMKLENAELEFDIQDYDNRYGVVEFSVLLV
jgi:hypothetical protein